VGWSDYRFRLHGLSPLVKKIPREVPYSGKKQVGEMEGFLSLLNEGIIKNKKYKIYCNYRRTSE
jgi:hypothetical protein